MNKLNIRQAVGVVLAVIGGFLLIVGFVAGFADLLAPATSPWVGLPVFLASILIAGGVVFLVLGRKAEPLRPAALPFVSPETETLLGVRRVLLLVGSALLLVGLSLPWFTATGGDAGTYGGVRLTSQLSSHLFGAYALNVFLATFGWLILVAVFGVTSAFVGRAFLWFGISGIAALALDSILVYAVPGHLHFTSVSVEYGFVSAVIGSALIETGARLKTPATRIALTRNPLSLGILFIVLGIVSNVGGGLTVFAGFSPDAVYAAIPFGWMMAVVGMVVLARPSLASSAARVAKPS